MASSNDFKMDELSSALQAHMIMSAKTPAAAAPAAAKAAPAKKEAPAKPKAEKAGKEPEAAAPAAATPAAADATPAYDRWNLADESTVDYGYLKKTGGEGIKDATTTGGFYLTTAINYTNGPAHMGHAYEASTSDVIARFHRLKGDTPTYFVTGSDEHGQKIANTAAEEGKEPIDICNKVRNEKCICIALYCIVLLCNRWGACSSSNLI
jgi:methionyl-tRNA synthetase